MTIEDAKTDLEAGHTLELDLPAHERYRAAIYHAFINEQKQYTCSVYYPGASTVYEPLAASTDWDTFFSQLAPVLQRHDKWTLL